MTKFYYRLVYANTVVFYWITSYSTGCLLPASTPVLSGQSPVIVLDDLGKVDIAEVLSDIIPVIENRGPGHVIKVHMGKIQHCVIKESRIND